MRKAGFTIVATLVTIALILFLAVYLMYGGSTGGGKSMRADGEGKTYLGAAMARGRDAECMEHLRSVRAGWELAVNSSGDEPPASLEDLKQPADYLRCPIGKKEPYVYNATATDSREAIKCVHPGHEKY
jgi:hypothetical protein